MTPKRAVKTMIPRAMASKRSAQMNSFMLYRQANRQTVNTTGSRMRNGEVSKVLGLRWKTLSKTERQPWEDRAKELRDEHQKMYPDHTYIPTKNKKRQKKQTEEDAPTARGKKTTGSKKGHSKP
ncbi:high mobility group box domain-containing protein [Xylariaceae sp. AK1471]|nr:high mobility group box domain-containing protein [Xylariaceae sp. AK1471]